MNLILPQKTQDPAIGNILKVAIMAVGGQGGGVLTGWIESLARAEGYDCQATSVAGVSQRTGATIYYIEMTPSTGQSPVFALAPSVGDVDILIASEMMEVGRAVLRGFVTPDRTTLIGSSHRALAVSEKSIPGDGIADSQEVRAAAEIAAQRLILADMEKLAVEQGSVVSASLLGALSASGSLPFTRMAFEETIRRSGKGVEASLRAFDAGFKLVTEGEEQLGDIPVSPPGMIGSQRLMGDWQALVARVEKFPEPVEAMARAGLQKVVDFQDCAYGAIYLNRLDKTLSLDAAEKHWLLSTTAAKYIAKAMAYDDIIRVTDIKTRAPRSKHIQKEMGANETQLMQLTEYFHPRAEEIAGMLPAKLGERVEKNPKMMARLDRWFGKGRRLRTDRLPAFLMLHFLGGLKSYRLRNRRHAVEMAHMEIWLKRSFAALDINYDLSVELLKCHRLIKGYSDTHSRGHSKFTKIMMAADRLQNHENAAEWVARLREAALKDPEDKTLDGALQTVNSFLE